MPNWCLNHIIIEGEGKKELMSAITNEKKKITFEKEMPTPTELLKMPAPMTNEISEDERKRLREKYGAHNWYEWRLNNWGCKWDALRTEYVNSFEVEFDTPWAPPLQFFANITKKYKNTKVRIQFADENMGQFPLGQTEIINGKVHDICVVPEGTNIAEQISDEIWDGIWSEKLQKRWEKETEKVEE